MSDLMLPAKGKSAASLLQDLNADHAPYIQRKEEPNVITLQETNEAPLVSTSEETKKPANTRSASTAEGQGAKVIVKHSTAGPEKTDPSRRDETAVRVPIDALAGSGREGRMARALEQASEDEITVVTVRVSNRLNEYMDRYIERINRVHPKRRYRKQDAIAEAFAAFYADHLMPPAPEENDL